MIIKNRILSIIMKGKAVTNCLEQPIIIKDPKTDESIKEPISILLSVSSVSETRVMAAPMKKRNQFSKSAGSTQPFMMIPPSTMVPVLTLHRQYYPFPLSGLGRVGVRQFFYLLFQLIPEQYCKDDNAHYQRHDKRINIKLYHSSSLVNFQITPHLIQQFFFLKSMLSIIAVLNLKRLYLQGPWLFRYHGACLFLFYAVWKKVHTHPLSFAHTILNLIYLFNARVFPKPRWRGKRKFIFRGEA